MLLPSCSSITIFPSKPTSPSLFFTWGAALWWALDPSLMNSCLAYSSREVNQPWGDSLQTPLRIRSLIIYLRDHESLDWDYILVATV